MGTFAYGDSYFGLRSYDQSTGVVQDASASASATSSASPVNWTIAIGSGPITIGATSTVTASGEGVIIERTDEFSYGMGNYGANAYTQGDLQIEVSSTSAFVNAIGERIHQANATASATSASTADSEQIFQGSITGSATSATTAQGAFTVSAQLNTASSTSTFTSACIRKRNASGIASSTSAEVTVGREKWEVIARTTTTWTELVA